jgi:general secretion pathway protein K
VEREISKAPALGADVTRRPGEHGFVMLVVLWVLTSAVILVSSFNGAVRGSTASAVSEVGWTKSEALIDAGVEVAAAHLIDQNKTRRWPGDGTKHIIKFAGAELTVSATDANGYIDLNKSDEKLLLSFFQKFTRSVVKAQQMTDIVMKARDAATGTGKQSQTDAASNAPQDTFSTRAAFIDVWEFGRTKGIPADLFNRVAPYLTVYSRDGTIDPIAAPHAVLEAIPDMDRADIEKLKYADKSAVGDIVQNAQAYLTDQSGPAYLVTVSAHRPDDGYSVNRTFVIATGVDPSAPYRLLAKLPMVSAPAEKMQ